MQRVPRCKCAKQQAREFDDAVTVDEQHSEKLGLGKPGEEEQAPFGIRSWEVILTESFEDLVNPIAESLEDWVCTTFNVPH